MRLTEDGWFWAKFIGIGLVLLVGCFVTVAVCMVHDQRACTEDCLAAKFRPNEKACAFYCAWDRPNGNATVVPVYMPVQQ